MSPEELLAQAEKAKVELDEATTRDDVASIFDHYTGILGYKVLARLLLGSSAADATGKWRARLDSTSS